MNENIAVPDFARLRAEIERLHIEGLSDQEIADELRQDRRVIGRNLRELKKRWARAAARQHSILSQTQCAAVYREAMDGWRRSLDPKVTTTEHRDKEDAIDKTIDRRQEGPGDKSFLMAAIGALKALRQFAADEPAKPPSGIDAVLVELLNIMTPEQVKELEDDQLQRFRRAVEVRRREIERRRREAEQRERRETRPRRPCWHSRGRPSRTTR